MLFSVRYRALFITFLSLFIYLVLEPVYGSSPPHKNQTLITEMKRWAIKVAFENLTFSYDNYFNRIKENKDFFTNKGCRTYMISMLDYGISDGVILRKETLQPLDIWKKYPHSNILDQVEIEDEHIDEFGLYTWKVSVPLVLSFRTETSESRYRFIAIFKINQLEKNSAKFKIETWYASARRGGFTPRFYKRNRPKKDYQFCYDLFELKQMNAD